MESGPSRPIITQDPALSKMTPHVAVTGKWDAAESATAVAWAILSPPWIRWLSARLDIGTPKTAV